jgi:copper chaperone
MADTLRGYNPRMAETLTYTVPAIHCEHCVMSVTEEVSEVEGVESVVVELETKLVTVRGSDLDDAALRAAIVEAGYQAA